MMAVNCAPVMNPRDEIFLHEWMHGLDGFYGRFPEVKLPKGALHGAGSHGYQEKVWRTGDTFRGWMEWYRDYLNGDVMKDGRRTGLGSAAWKRGPMRSTAAKVAGNYRPKPLDVKTYPLWEGLQVLRKVGRSFGASVYAKWVIPWGKTSPPTTPAEAKTGLQMNAQLKRTK